MVDHLSCVSDPARQLGLQKQPGGSCFYTQTSFLLNLQNHTKTTNSNIKGFCTAQHLLILSWKFKLTTQTNTSLTQIVISDISRTFTLIIAKFLHWSSAAVCDSAPLLGEMNSEKQSGEHRSSFLSSYILCYHRNNRRGGGLPVLLRTGSDVTGSVTDWKKLKEINAKKKKKSRNCSTNPAAVLLPLPSSTEERSAGTLTVSSSVS